MESYVIAVDQSTSATKAFLYDEDGLLLGSAGIPHRQYYPREGWVEHDPEEIYVNTVKVIQKSPARKAGRPDVVLLWPSPIRERRS